MLLPGRKYSTGIAYRYGFNGQEKSNEIGEGFTTAEFWEYDSRIGRRWNIDPVKKEYESPYLCFSGNPLWFKDSQGNDTTKYYNNNGDLLMTIGNGKNGYNRAMVVNDNKVEAIKQYAKKYYTSLNSKFGVSNTATIYAQFKEQGYGVVYDIASIIKFLNDNKNRKAKYFDINDKVHDYKITNYTDLSLNGRSLKWIRSETTGGMVLQNNIVTVGTPSYFINKDMVTQSDYYNNSEPNCVSGIHDHPFGGDPGKEIVVNYKKSIFFSSWGFSPGPSPNSDGSGDKSPGNKPMAGYRNVLIDDKHIYLYDNVHPNVVIKY